MWLLPIPPFVRFRDDAVGGRSQSGSEARCKVMVTAYEYEEIQFLRRLLSRYDVSGQISPIEWGSPGDVASGHVGEPRDCDGHREIH
jgi:hypothetical protein